MKQTFTLHTHITISKTCESHFIKIKKKITIFDWYMNQNKIIKIQNENNQIKDSGYNNYAYRVVLKKIITE